METKIIRIEKDAYEEAEDSLKEAGEIIRRGGLVAFPTETVYGLGGDALNKEAAARIYAAKGRPSDNPLIVHISRMEDLDRLVKQVPEAAYRLAEAFWPGPLTMIMEKSPLVPSQTTGGLDTVAVRMPSHPVARRFITLAGGYVAAPSANLSGRPSPTRAKYVIEDMAGRIDMILDGDGVDIGLESTIVDLTGEVPMILRPGYITEEMLTGVLGQVDTDKTILDIHCQDRPKAPGMRYRHYAPKGELTILEGEASRVICRINALTEQKQAAGEKVGVIGTAETVSAYRADSVKSVGSRTDEESIARNLYQVLREFDDEGVTVIYSESFDRPGMGQAIMNRLLKAAGHKIEYI
jgi:L-threonylcarbamoyladenylate synthase